MTSQPKIRVAIACGGTGGHLFPGMVVGEELLIRGAEVQLLISPKAVDQEAARSALGMKVETLPAVGLSGGNYLKFLAAFWKARVAARALFRRVKPDAVLAMGGFTAAPAVLAGRRCKAATFLHESNAIPGRANRWLARVVDQAFVGFPAAGQRLQHVQSLVTGTPVRRSFEESDPAACRRALGLDPVHPVLLVMGGSQGAGGVNELVLRALPVLEGTIPELQIIHLCGPAHLERVQGAYRGRELRSLVRPFMTEMELALGAATVAVTRAGASTLAELAAMRVAAILVPYPFAADDHQRANAEQFTRVGAAWTLKERGATGQVLAEQVVRLILDEPTRVRIGEALATWRAPHAAQVIAERMLQCVRESGRVGSAPAAGQGPSGAQRDCLVGGAERC